MYREGAARESIYLREIQKILDDGMEVIKRSSLNFFSFPCESDWMDDVHVIQIAYTHTNFSVYEYILFLCERQRVRENF